MTSYLAASQTAKRGLLAANSSFLPATKVELILYTLFLTFPTI